MRFGGIGRLYGATALNKFRGSHVCVVGIGGVGTWAAEALARSGIGKITLVDMDDICVTNVNRQLHALEGSIGISKVTAIAERIQSINPEAEVRSIEEFFTTLNAEQILGAGFDHVVDAIDNMANKCLLISESRKREIPIVTCGGAGGLQSGLGIRIDDLSRSTNDALLRLVRKKLRREYEFPTNLNEPFDVTAVFSTGSPVYPWRDGSVCKNKEEGSALQLDCASGFGTATFVTGAIGFAAAEHVIRSLADQPSTKTD